MKTYQLAAAVLTAITATSAQAEVFEKKVCVPVSVIDGKAQIVALCDATDVNKQYNLKLNDEGCAASGQSLYAGNGAVYDQSSAYIWAESQEDLDKKTPVACLVDDAALFYVEL